MQNTDIDRLPDQTAATGTTQTPAAAHPNVVAEVVVEGRIDPFGDVDCFSVDLVAGNWYELELVVHEPVGLDPLVQNYAYAYVNTYSPEEGHLWIGHWVDLLRASPDRPQAFQAQATGPVVVNVAALSTNSALGYSYELRLAQVAEPSRQVDQWSGRSWPAWPAWPETLDTDAPLLPLGQWQEGQVSGESTGHSASGVSRIARADGQRLMVSLEIVDAPGTDNDVVVYATDFYTDGSIRSRSEIGAADGSHVSWILEPNGASDSALMLFWEPSNPRSAEPLRYRLLVQAVVVDDFPWHAPGTLHDGLPQALRVEPSDVDVFGLEVNAGEVWLLWSKPLQDSRASFWVTPGSSDKLQWLDWGYADNGATWVLAQAIVDTQLEVNVHGYTYQGTAWLANDASPTHTLLAQRVQLNEQATRPQVWPAGEPMAGQVNPLMGLNIVLVELQAHQRYALEVQGGAVDITLFPAASVAERTGVRSSYDIPNGLKWMQHVPTPDAPQRPQYVSVEVSGWYALSLSPTDKSDPIKLVSYELNLTPVPMDDHGDTTATATRTQEWQTHFARLQPSDVDVFALDLQAGERYAARLVGDGAWGEAWCYLMDDAGQPAGMGVNVGRSMVDQPFVVPTSGRYYLRLEAAVDANVTFAYLPVDDDDHGDAWFNATPLQMVSPNGVLTVEPSDSPFTVGVMGVYDSASSPMFEVPGS